MMEKKPRLIFHCDCNSFFASCEILDQPGLRDVPMAVAGRKESIIINQRRYSRKPLVILAFL